MIAAVHNRLKHITWVALLGLPMFVFADQYLTVQEFLAKSFIEKPKLEKFWLNKAHQQKAEKILGHRVNAMRIRYWVAGGKTAWIIEKIGKEKPISTGIVIANNKIQNLTILAFRESRGWEVKYPFFTQQFTGLTLTDDLKLSERIDGITGATLSVRSVKKSSQWALYLHSQLSFPVQEASHESD